MTMAKIRKINKMHPYHKGRSKNIFMCRQHNFGCRKPKRIHTHTHTHTQVSELIMGFSDVVGSKIYLQK